MITIECPECGREHDWPDDYLGDRVDCPSCHRLITLTRSDRGSRYAEDRPTRRRHDADEDEDDFRSRRGRLAPHRGQLILILGILSLIGTGIFTGIPAWIMGNHDLKEIRAGRMDPEGESNTNIGRILGMVCTILTLVSFVLVCGSYALLFLLFAGAAAGGP